MDPKNLEHVHIDNIEQPLCSIYQPKQSDVLLFQFQFSEQPLVENKFTLEENKSGTGDARNIINMINLQMEDENEKERGNFQEIFSTTLAKVGSNVQANKLSLTAAKSNMEAAEGSESEFAGVNLDEEAANLLEFQQAYQASARILQTARELFQTLIDVV